MELAETSIKALKRQTGTSIAGAGSRKPSAGFVHRQAVNDRASLIGAVFDMPMQGWHGAPVLIPRIC